MSPRLSGRIGPPAAKRRALAASSRPAFVQLCARFAAAVVTLLYLTSAVSAAAWTPKKAAEANRVVEQFLVHLNASHPDLPEAALSLAIGSHDELLLAKGFGEAAPGVPATAHTVYHIGSIAKQFTAAAVLDLIARHAHLRNGTLLSLDLALADIFDGVEHWTAHGRGPQKHAVTLRNLLTMTSNLPNFTRRPPPATNPWGRIGAPELLSEVKKMRPWGWPNTFEYSNTSYFLLAEVIEEAVAPGEARPSAYYDYLRRNIFPRAGLIETGFIGHYAPGSEVAIPVGRRLRVFDQPSWLKGSADMTSSAADLFAWNSAFMGGRILQPESAALMITGTGRVSPEIYYGMGWFVEYRRDHEVFSHAGIVPGYTSINMIAAETGGDRGWTSVTLLLNTDVAPDDLQNLAKELMRLAQER
ncbi:hypothetical protein W911_16185 [Hyphomicrobium nitrativorans NL23]|uniref:Beta-lactamase-related domain-containing protein n=1 Tax=Hyphomicrobium nitrativorans NL23 TaxID=1029756 RepID=V5SJX8_9HYPH|nr:serine hydrolase domain-containing protein [Hyphomicrobium nitrativorans]AHB50405.1 hypothetical protein W911_16185 [Hyphomicrobium nitrativorans NL23]